EGCNEPDTRVDEGSKLNHSHTNYVSNGDATCTEDGTETAICDRIGCSEPHTRVDEGSKLGHSYNNVGGCDNCELKVESITVAGTKTHFIEQDTINLSLYTVTATYNDNSTFNVTKFTVDKTKVSINDTYLEFSFAEKTCRLDITVEKKVVDLEFSLNKMSYFAGESLDLTGLVVTAVYLDNTKNVITDYTVTHLDKTILEFGTEVNIGFKNYSEKLPITISYVEFDDYDLTYIKNQTEYKISRYTGIDTEILIPEVYNDVKITELGENAFEEGKNLKVIRIQNNIEKISDKTFDGCNEVFIAIEADSAPDGWSENWNKFNYPVVYAFKSISVDDYYDYVIYNDSIYITNYKGMAETLIVPETIEEKPVVFLSSVFEGNTYLKNVKLPDSITVLENYVFNGCTNLEKVVMPSNLTSIGMNAFYNCRKLTSIIIPSSVTNIGSYAFYECSSLTSVTFGENSKLTSIGSYAFYNCSSLTSVTFGENSKLESIGSYAFYNCRSLTSVTFGENSKLTSIGYDAFRNCSSLTSIEIPSSVTSIGIAAFSSCSSLTSVYYGGTLENWCNIEFYGWSSNPMEYAKQFYIKDGNNEYKELTEIEIPESVTEIKDYTFYNIKTITKVTIHSGVTSIGSYAFEYCSSLTDVYYDGTIEQWFNIEFGYYSINDIYYFSNPMKHAENFFIKDGNSEYKKLTEIEIPESVTEIKDYTFYGFNKITKVTIPESVTSIGNHAFENCSSLTSIEIPSSVESVGYYAFSGCSCKIICYSIYSSNWNRAWNPSNCPVEWMGEEGEDELFEYVITEKGKHIVKYIGTLTEVVIPSDVIIIGSYAFSGCSSLTSIEIPSSVESIGYSAFSRCSSLVSITLPIVGGSETKNTYLGYIFGSSSYLDISSYVPKSLKEVILTNCTSIGSYAFYGCSSLTSIEIPSSVKSIGE
ncbi:MAG: leucine-rich repeat domain-containing protein, partial [Clostridia bacterium]|nr:leucine-rich repeat domain-containing protein [Clostridia bacterium]